VAPVLGVDPGKSGAAVLIDGKRILAAAAWSDRVRGGKPQYLIRFTADGETVQTGTSRTPHGIGRFLHGYFRIYAGKPWFLRVEDMYVRQNIATSVIMARSAGALSGPLEDYAIGPAEWVKASVWRKQVLRMNPYTKRGKAKHVAQTFIPLFFGGEPSLSAIATAFDVTTEHLTDAAGIALSKTMESPTK
jgi:hypothetical protein